MRLAHRENKGHELNHLQMKRNLISNAVGKKRPRKKRNYVNHLVKFVKKFTTTLQLPESTSMKVTKRIYHNHVLHDKEVAPEDLIIR